MLNERLQKVGLVGLDELDIEPGLDLQTGTLPSCRPKVWCLMGNALDDSIVLFSEGFRIDIDDQVTSDWL